jgi:hypothetical protein
MTGMAAVFLDALAAAALGGGGTFGLACKAVRAHRWKARVSKMAAGRSATVRCAASAGGGLSLSENCGSEIQTNGLGLWAGSWS